MGECVRCHYSLHGLPDTHLFPECGLAYDPDMQVIRLEARSFARNQLFYEVLLIALFFSSWRNLEPGERLQTAIFCGLVGILAVVIWARGPSSSTAQAMFLTHRGIVLDFFGDPDEVIDWAAFHHASYKWLGGACGMGRHGGARVLSRGLRFFGSPRLARKCVRELNRARQSYSDLKTVRKSAPESV